MGLSNYFKNSQKSHLDLMDRAMQKGDGLTAIYHTKVFEQQEKEKRVLANVEKKIVYLQTFKHVLMKKENYNPYK